MSNESLKTESAWLLSGLYQGGLFIGNEPVVDNVEHQKTEAKEIEEIKAELEVLPSFKARIIHWIEEDSTFPYKDMIGKIMSALKWNGEPIQTSEFIFINKDESSYSFEELISANAFQCERIIFWSSRDPKIKGNDFLHVESPSIVAKDKETKIKYWNLIKSYFGN